MHTMITGQSVLPVYFAKIVLQFSLFDKRTNQSQLLSASQCLPSSRVVHRKSATPREQLMVKRHTQMVQQKRH